MQFTKYTAIYAKTITGYSAHIPDLPGCIATGRTLELTKRRMRAAVALHLKGMREDGESIPQPTTQADEIEAAGGEPAAGILCEAISVPGLDAWTRRSRHDPVPH